MMHEFWTFLSLLMTPVPPPTLRLVLLDSVLVPTYGLTNDFSYDG